MAVEIGALRALLSLDTAAFETGIKRATAGMGKVEAKLRTVGKRFDAIGKDLSKKVSLPMITMAGVAVRSSLKVVDSQAKMAQSLDTSTRSLQVLARASETAGISQGDLEGSLRRMTRRLSLAERGTGAAVKALDTLNLSAADLSGMDADERVALITRRIREMVPEAQQAGIASEVFGDKTGLAMMRLDPAVIASASAEIKKFGVGVSEVDAAKIEAANDAMSSLGLVARGIANQLTVALAPTLQAIAEKMAKVGQWFAQLSPEGKRFAAVAATVAAAAGPAAIAIGLVATGLAAVASPIGVVIGGLAALGAGAAYVVANWDDLKARFPILERAADFGVTLKQKWSNLPSIKWAALIPVLSFAKFIPGLRWAAFIPKVAWKTLITSLKWAAFIPKLSWKALIPVLKWSSRFIPVIGWASLAGGLAWKLLIKPLGWDKYLPKIEWDGWIPSIKWPDWISEVNWKVFIPLVDWSYWFSFEWANLLPEWDWSKIIPDFKSWFQFSGVRDQAKAAGEDISAGLIQGARVGRSGVRSAGEELAGETIRGFEDEAGIQSPSRVFAQLGEYLVEGLVVGLDDRAQDAIDRAAKLGEDMAKSARDAAEPVLRTVADGLATGDIGSIGTGLARQATGAFSDSLQDIFKGTQTFGGMITSSMSKVSDAMTGAGTLFGKVGAAVGAAMPVIGAVLAGVEIVKGIVGTTTKLTNAIEGTFDMTGLIAGGEYDIKRNDNMFGSSTEKNFEAWEGSWAEDIGRHANKVMQDVSDNMVTAIESLGLEVQEGVEHSFDFKFEEGSLPDGELYRVVEAEAAKAGDAMLKASLQAAGLAREGESGAQTLQALNASLALANGAFDRMGKDLLDIHAVSAGAARGLVEAAGGLDAFAAKSDFVIANLMTTSEQSARAVEMAKDTLISAFDGLDIAIPKTPAQFMSLLDAQNVMTEQGRQTYAALIDVADEFVTVNGTAQEAKEALMDMGSAITGLTAEARRAIEADIAAGQAVLRNRAVAADEAVQVAQDALAAAEQALRDARAEGDAWRQAQYDAVQDAARIAADAARAADDALREAEQALTKAFRAEQDRVRELYADQIDAAREESAVLVDAWQEGQKLERERLAEQVKAAREASDAMVAGYQTQIKAIQEQAKLDRERLDSEIDSAGGRVALARSISDALKDALDNRQVLDRDGERMQLADASRFLADAVAAGGTTDERGLENALSVVADPSEDLFTSYEQYQQAFNVNTNRIKVLGDLADDSLTVEERTLDELERQREAIDTSAELQIEALQDQIEAQKEMTDEQIEAFENASEVEVERLQGLIDGQSEVLSDQVERLQEMRDENVETLQDQLNDLLGIETAVGTIADAADDLAEAQEAASSATKDAAEAAQTAAEASVEAFGLLVDEIAAMRDVDDAKDDLDDAKDDADKADDAVNPNTDGTEEDFTPDGPSDKLDDLFQKHLGRGIDSAGLDFYGGLLADGMSLGDIEKNIRQSDEAMLYRAETGKGVEGKINRAFNRILGRNVDLPGLKFYVEEMDDGLTFEKLFEDLRKNKDSDTGIPAFAQGTNFAPGGVALVGEEGAELVELPRGSRVRTASATRRAFGAGFDAFAQGQQSSNVATNFSRALVRAAESAVAKLGGIDATLSRHANAVSVSLSRMLNFAQTDASVREARHEELLLSLDAIEVGLADLGERMSSLAKAAADAASAANQAAAKSAAAAESYAAARVEAQQERDALLSAMTGPDMDGAAAANERVNERLVAQGEETNARLEDVRRALNRQADLKKIEMNSNLEQPA